MFLIYFIYAIVLGIFVYYIFQTNFAELLFYVVIAELCIFLSFDKFDVEYTPALRFLYLSSFFIGYFSTFICNENVNNLDPNLPLDFF